MCEPHLFACRPAKAGQDTHVFIHPAVRDVERDQEALHCVQTRLVSVKPAPFATISCDRSSKNTKAYSKCNSHNNSPGSPMGAVATAVASDDVELAVAIVAESGAARGCSRSDVGVSAGVAFAAGAEGGGLSSSSPARFSPGEMRSCEQVWEGS